jgi:hypothetical protein
MQNLPEAVHDDDAVGLREDGSTSGVPWTVRGIMRCCGITEVCFLCFLGILFLLVVMFV